MTQPITFVVLSTGLDNFKDIRKALSAEGRVQLLAGGNDPEQLYEEIVRLKPNAAIIALGPNPEAAVKFIQRLNRECPQTAIISGGADASPDLILRSLRAGAREFLRIPISVEADRVTAFARDGLAHACDALVIVAVCNDKNRHDSSLRVTPRQWPLK